MLDGMNQEKCWDYFQTEGIDSFDQSYARHQYMARRLGSLAKRLPATRLRVLNVGVGNGLFEELCIKAGHEVWSLDPSEKAVRLLEKKIPIHAVIGRVQDDLLPENSFSVVNMSEVLEHFTDSELEEALKSVYRLLVSGGLFVGTVPYQEKLRDNIVVCPHCGETFHRWGHHQSFTTQRLSQLLQQYFPAVNTSVRPFVAWSKLNWKGKVLGGLQRLLAFVGVHGHNESIVFHARKA